jgi:hypothetical protein
VERPPSTDGNQRFANRERRAAVGQANLNDCLDTLGDQQVAKGVAIALGDRDCFEVVGAVTSPRRTIVCESTAYVAHSFAALFSAQCAFQSVVHHAPML